MDDKPVASLRSLVLGLSLFHTYNIPPIRVVVKGSSVKEMSRTIFTLCAGVEGKVYFLTPTLADHV